MCIAVSIQHSQHKQRIYFNQRNSILPYFKQHHCHTLTWGRRERESGELPIGGWAREDNLQRGLWDKWFPKRVLLAVNAFCLHDFLGRAHWFSLSTSEYIQGIIVHDDHEQRIYIATLLTERLDNSFLQWPRIIKYPHQHVLSTTGIPMKDVSKGK